jgi:hypothetical protein
VILESCRNRMMIIKSCQYWMVIMELRKFLMMMIMAVLDGDNRTILGSDQGFTSVLVMSFESCRY